ncbi:MAG TPA: hypothetical protein RMH99_30360 [Sandaracinaceae bacterium LLY-WYZ-13_1]|nr:hypothetical protein [Sandaracinaceae bacterium LLY-WYZ-13_1]
MSRRVAVALPVLLALGCQPDLGECDQPAAFELVYTEDGVPAFAGQALMNQSCGGGGFCHASGIPAEDRYGVPHGLGMDLRPASTTDAPRDGETARLSRDQVTVYEQRHEVWGQVDSGRMPPALPAMDREKLAQAAPRYDRVADDGVTFEPLPGIDTDEGRAILRNWLACGTPVVERTVPRSDAAPPVGYVVPACRRRCIDPTWPAIHEAIVAPRCATAGCHDAETEAGALDLSAGPAALRAQLVDQTPAGLLCGSASDFADTPMIAPGDPEGSLLWVKVAPTGDRCGSTMPLSGAPLSEQALCALREWIAAGAPAEAPGPDELEALRSRCGVTVEAGEPTCAMPTPCPPEFDPERG